MYEDIITFSNDGKTIPYYVSMCGISYCDGTYLINRPNSRVSVIEYIISGTGTVQEDDNIFYPHEGEIYYLRSGHNHFYYSDDKNPWTKVWVNFEGNLADDIAKSYNLVKSHFYAPELKQYFMRMYDISRNAEGTRSISDKIILIFTEIMQMLASKYFEQKNNNISQIAKDTKEKLDDISDYRITLNEAIKSLAYSKCHIIREFKGAYGITPYEYLLNKRFNIAKAMLENTNMSVSSIAEKLGFCDAHYFSRCFSKRFGVSPSIYRKQIRSKL